MSKQKKKNSYYKNGDDQNKNGNYKNDNYRKKNFDVQRDKLDNNNYQNKNSDYKKNLSVDKDYNINYKKEKSYNNLEEVTKEEKINVENNLYEIENDIESDIENNIENNMESDIENDIYDIEEKGIETADYESDEKDIENDIYDIDETSHKDHPKERPNNLKKNKKYSHKFVHFFLILVMFSGIGFFIVNLFFNKNSDNNLYILINSLLLVLFSVIYTIVSICSNRKSKSIIFINSLLLFAYFIFNILITLDIMQFNNFGKMENFTGKSLTDVIEWAEKNDIELNQEYEYSDMIGEYQIIGQDIKEGTNLKEIKDLTVVVSEGPNPSKEIIVPNMVSWTSEDVIKFVNDNYLSKVEVEFTSSDKAQDTVIEQSKSGNVKRDEEIKLTFSEGEELGYDEVKLIDFTNKGKFEVEFYLKQHHLKYEIKKDFSSKIKRNYAMKQDKKAGSMVKIDSDDDKVTVTLSKGKKIKIPDLKKMKITEITDFIIKNKLKLELTDKYDDKIAENDIISSSHNKGDVVEQGEVIKIVVSKGSLKMPKFKTYEEFREWATKYDIKYEEKHEFSDKVAAGEVISYSYKKGETIKNDDVIIVTISDGEAVKVPDLKGLSKSDAASKLKKLGFKYNFVYKSSNSVAKDKVISQSISAGSEISKETTITVTLSSGKEEKSSVKKRETDSEKENSSSNKTSQSNSSSSSSNSNTSSTNPSTNECDKSKGAELNIQAGSSGSQTKSMIKQMNPKHKFNFVDVNSCDNGDSTPGNICTLGLEGVWKNYCDTITIKIVK